MRTFNLRLAIILLVIVVAAGIGVYFLHNAQVLRNADVFQTGGRQGPRTCRGSSQGQGRRRREGRHQGLHPESRLVHEAPPR